MPIQCFDDFVKALETAGFSMGGPNAEGIFTLCSKFDQNILWHTGDSDTDPWEWRIRILNENDSVSYGKLFFKKSGYITKEWYPYFLAARRGRYSLEELYEDGTISHTARRIYELVVNEGLLPAHMIRSLGDFSAEDKSAIERALTELQMKLFITICGSQQKVSSKQQSYGWNSTVFCTTEHFWGDDLFQQSAAIKREDAISAIRTQILTLNPQASDKKIKAFIAPIGL